MSSFYRALSTSVVLVACMSSVAEARPRPVTVFPADAGVIDVTDWGVVPNDGQDDTAAIQRIFDLMTPSGKIVYFPDGRYDLSGQVTLRKRDYEAEAEDLVGESWVSGTEGERSYVVAGASGAGPDDAARLTYRFTGIDGIRRVRIGFRAPEGGTVWFRLNGGDWQTRDLAPRADWWDDRVLTDSGRVATGENVLEVAATAGVAVDDLRLDYGAAYLSNTIVQGQSRDGTVLRLANRLAGADGRPFSDAVIGWEAGVEQFFRTAVRSLTINVGANNPEADGLRFHGNNQAVIEDVLLIGQGKSGDVGLDLAYSAAIGPILVRDLQVRGFDVGIHSGWQNASRTFERIQLFGQREFGWVNEAASAVFVSQLTSRNSVPAIRNTGWRLPGDGNGRMVLIDSGLIGRPGAEDETAISTYGQMFVRNVKTPGYARAIDNRNQDAFRAYRGQDGIDGEYVEEWWSAGAYGGAGGGFYRLFDDSVDTTIRLGRPREPFVPMDPPEAWTSPLAHQVTLPDGRVSGRPDDGVDDTLAIQASIDSGASTVYLPNGQWDLVGTVEMRGNVRRFLGTEASIETSIGGADPRIVIGPDGPNDVVIERLANFGFGKKRPVFEHRSLRRVTFRDVTGLDYRPNETGRTGNVHISDTVGRSITFRNQSATISQLNIEEFGNRPDSSQDAKVINDGARVSILGFKTEQEGIHVRTVNGGRTEVLGQLHLNDFGSGTPQYVTEDASLSVVVNVKPYEELGTTYGTVVETRDGVTRTGRIMGTGYIALSAADLWRFKKEVVLDDDASEGVAYEGDWAGSDGFPRGHIGRGFSYASSGPSTVTYMPNLPTGGTYKVWARWPATWGGQARGRHASAATFVIGHAGGEIGVTVDQRHGSDGWYLLGTYQFDEGASGMVSLSAEGADGTVVTDGVRFRRVRR